MHDLSLGITITVNACTISMLGDSTRGIPALVKASRVPRSLSAIMRIVLAMSNGLLQEMVKKSVRWGFSIDSSKRRCSTRFSGFLKKKACWAC